MQCLWSFWRLIGPNSDVPFVCTLYRLPDGSLELRAGHGEQDPLLRQHVQTEAAAETLAETWRAAAEAKGFRDLDQAGSSGAA
jgi:hypothetical protein